MKKSFQVLCLAASAFLATAGLSAQTYNVTYGRTTVTVDPNLLASFKNYFTLTDLQGRSLSSPLILKVLAGTLTTSDGTAEIIHTGGLLGVANGTSVQIQDLILDTTNANSPVVTAMIVANGGRIGRTPVFNVSVPSSGAATVQNSAVLQTGYAFRLTPQIVSLVNQLTGVPLVANDEYFGSVTLYSTLSSTPSASN